MSVIKKTTTTKKKQHNLKCCEFEEKYPLISARREIKTKDANSTLLTSKSGRTLFLKSLLRMGKLLMFSAFLPHFFHNSHALMKRRECTFCNSLISRSAILLAKTGFCNQQG
jgi:hypothetical protein